MDVEVQLLVWRVTCIRLVQFQYLNRHLEIYIKNPSLLTPRFFILLLRERQKWKGLLMWERVQNNQCSFVNGSSEHSIHFSLFFSKPFSSDYFCLCVHSVENILFFFWGIWWDLPLYLGFTSEFEASWSNLSRFGVEMGIFGFRLELWTAINGEWRVLSHEKEVQKYDKSRCRVFLKVLSFIAATIVHLLFGGHVASGL